MGRNRIFSRLSLIRILPHADAWLYKTSERGRNMSEKGMFIATGVAALVGILVTVAAAIAIVIGIIYLITNPQVIGEFFGNIVSGFNSVK